MGSVTNELTGGLAQLGERGVRNAKVAGSIPVPSTKFFKGLHLLGGKEAMQCHRAFLSEIKRIMS